MTMTQERTRNGIARAAGSPAQPGGSPRRTRPADPASAVPLRLAFDDCDSFADAVDALSLAPFIDGTQPWARSQRLDRVREDATLLPPGVAPIRSTSGAGASAVLAVGAGWTLSAVRWSGGNGEVSVTAVSAELAESVLALAVEGAAAPPEPDDDVVEIGFWFQTTTGPRRRARPISAQPWAQLRGNYAAPVAATLDRLVALDADHLPGRILLLHGPPGTGKTTALRCLAREWRSWCQLDFVVDPERLFADPGYLTEVIIGAGGDDDSWRLLLLEDCDELIRPGAKQSAGQALSRLLNLTDGLLGQGRRVLVAITTNEDVATLHPAVTRPGRCLGQIEVGPLPYAEAVTWLGHSTGVPAGGATLAELLALRDGASPVATPEKPAPTGLYL